MKHFGDITKINGAEVPMVDIITGGSPCQDLSVAGKRAGLKHSDKGDEETTRSGLFMEQIRIVKEMRNESLRQLSMRGATYDMGCIQPRYMVWENVPGSFSSNKGEDFRAVLEETARIKDEDAVIPRPENNKWSYSGCIMGDGWSIAWRLHDAQFWGVPQRRKRISLVADFGGQSAPEILFERKSMSGDTSEIREERKDIASYIGGSSCETIGVNEGCVLIENHPTDSRVKICEDNIVPTLASRMGTGGNNVPLVLEKQEEPILLESNQNHATVQTDGISTTLPASMGMGGGYVPMVFEPVSFGNGQLHDAMSPSIDIAKTLNCMDDPAKIVTYGLDRASFNQGKNAKYDFQIDEEKIGTQVAKGPGAVFQSVVRRLTPMECERLQGYPDGWTDIGDWIDSKGKKHKGDSDSPRYKALGNSIALPFWEWMAERMVQYIDHDPTMASLFDGIGGFPLVFSRCGCSPVWASEIEEFPIAVTKLRFGGE